MSDETSEDMIDAWGETWDPEDWVGLGPAPTVKANDPRPPLTARQAAVVAAIHGLTAARQVPPSRREVTSAVGCTSPNSLTYHFEALVRKGYLRQPKPLLQRDLVLLPPPGAETRAHPPRDESPIPA